MAEHNETGKQGEAIALRELKKLGYEILTTNWHYRKAELDIIAREGDELLIVEVKTRTSSVFEDPKEAVTLRKQKHIIRAADAFIQENGIELECRFDIFSVLIEKGKVNWEHIKDAFYPLL